MPTRKLGRDAKTGRFVDPSSPAAAKKFAKDADAFVKEHSKSKKAARAVLVAMGIYTNTGQLTSKYKNNKTAKK